MIPEARALHRRFRSVGPLRELADANAAHRPPTPAAVRVVNQALRHRDTPELSVVDGLVALGHRHSDNPLAEALGRLAEPLVRELAAGQPDRFRICANDRCRWIFYDTSRPNRRRWCEMATCGNRAKAARHRARQREREDAEPSVATGPSRPAVRAAERAGPTG